MAMIETYTEIVLDLLTPTSVNIVKKVFADINGIKTQIGPNVGSSYVNSPADRENLKKDLPEEYYNTILTLWGAEPTLEDFKDLNKE